MSYADSGVDVAAAERFAAGLADTVRATWGERVVGGFGGFAAGVRMPPDVPDPVVFMTTDGVGTKSELAIALDRYDTIGQDLVAMCVDDLAAAGAQPLAMTDYLAVGELRPERDADIVSGVARGCAQARCALVGGETAVHPGVLAPERFDLAGAAIGVAPAASVPDPGSVSPGNVVIGMSSPNLRANGFSLVRAVVDDWDAQPEGLDAPIGVTALEPSVIYAPAVLDARAAIPFPAMAHVTGGGLEANLARSLSRGVRATIDWSSWEVPAIFRLVQELGEVAEDEMRRTFNMGVGFVIVCPADRCVEAIEMLGHEARVIGEIVPA